MNAVCSRRRPGWREGLGFRVWGLGSTVFGIWGLGFKVWSLGSTIFGI